LLIHPSAIRFCLNLYQHHGLSISQAYARAIQQFRALRAEHHVATMTAALEAEEHGAVFGVGEITRSFLLEGKMLQDSYDAATKDEDVSAANKRWRAILDKKMHGEKWSRGQAYVRLWQTGVRPTYLKSLTDSTQKAVKPPKPRRVPVQQQSESVQQQGPMKQEVDHFHIASV
jgi:small subunit ribosomal protein S23